MTTLQHIPAAEYHAIKALSNHGMKDMAVSPLRYWFRHINPEAPTVKPSPEQEFGSALHALVLEPQQFTERYACMLSQEDYPACLVTIEDLRNYIRDKGGKPAGTRKAEMIQQVQALEADVPIWDVIENEHVKLTAGKICFPKDVWTRIHGCAEALNNEPTVQVLLDQGTPEPSIVLEDSDGIPMKARLDWIGVSGIVDLKTFTQKRGKSIDQSIADAIFWEGYYRQAYWYATLHQQATGATKPTRLCMAFVESDPPHEVRIKEMRPSVQGTPNVWWQRARIECRHYKNLWADHMREFGVKPWRREAEIDPLEDHELKGLAFS